MLITNFASGELSPTLNGRIDLQQYYQGASHLENFEIIPTGGIKRRKGTKRLENLGANCRIIPFIVDGQNIFVLALKANAIEVYSVQLNAQGELKTTFVKTIITSYASLAEIKELQYAQTYDTLVFTHRKYTPLWLKFENGTINAAVMTPDFYPDVVLQDPEDQIMLVAGNATAPSKTTTAAGALQFTYTPVGGGAAKTKVYSYGASGYYLRNGILYKYPFGGSNWEPTGGSVSVNTDLFTTLHNYPGCVTFFNNRLVFASTENKQQKVWASMAPDANDNRYNKFATYKKYITVNRSLKDADLHTFTGDIVKTDVHTSEGYTTISNISQSLASISDPTKYYVSNEHIPVGTKVISINAAARTMNIATTDIIFTEEQESIDNLVINISLWKSTDQPTADDYEYNIAEQNVTTADCSFNFELASDQNDAIKFISSNKFMAIATESTIWSMAPGCTALNVSVENQGRYGSDAIQGQSVAQATIYFAQGCKGIREFYYDQQSEAFQTNNIAIHAQHLLREDKIVDFDYLTNPYNRLILTRESGSVISLMYDKTNGVMAWNRQTRISGAYRSAAVTRGFDENDLVFYVVEETIDDIKSYYLEVLDEAEEIYLDSWKKYEGATTGYTQEAILWNKTQDKTCSAFNIPDDFAAENDSVYIGYQIKSYIKSMPCLTNDPNGKKRITNLIVRFLESYMPRLKVTGVSDEFFSTITSLPYSGVAQITYPGTTNRDVYFELETTDVHPVQILAVNALLA